MKVLFLLFVVTIDNHGFETMSRFNDVEYVTKSQCEKTLKKSKVKNNQTLFCGENYLYFNKQQKSF